MVPTTQNREWGFFGTIQGNKTVLWERAFNEIKHATQANDDSIRRFLDGRRGRHFADDVNEYGIEATIEKWTTWNAPRSLRCDKRVPKGANYLVAEVSVSLV